MNKIIHGDCIEEMAKLPENSVDAIVTDPPYGLEFMGKEWDKFKSDKRNIEKDKSNPHARSMIRSGIYKDGALTELQKFSFNWATQALRVLKPGGHLLSFGGTRTYHRMVCGLEDAGFEIRDCIMWLYGSGFPKSLDISRNIDRELCEIVGKHFLNEPSDEKKNQYPDWHICKELFKKVGFGTALKPAIEPIVLARKPLSEKNISLNVLKWGTGGLNIDGCRIGTIAKSFNDNRNEKIQRNAYGKFNVSDYDGSKGRFPANIILDDKVKLPFGASRFFYCAKASKSERNYGCEELENNTTDDGREVVSDRPHQRGATQRKNSHPCVKPLKLMQYLIRLVCPPNAVVLDPFLGSGTIVIACLKENRQFIGIEKNEEYVKIAKARIKPFLEQKRLG